MPDFNAKADLHRLEMRASIPGQKNQPGPRWLESGTAGDLIKKVIAKREGDQPVYSITVPLEAGFGKDTLHFHDIQDFAQHANFPK